MYILTLSMKKNLYQTQYLNPSYEAVQLNFMFPSVLPRIMNFGRIRIPNNIRIFKNDEYEYYSEFEKLFEYYSWEIFK